MYSQRKIKQIIREENIKRGVIDDIPPFCIHEDKELPLEIASRNTQGENQIDHSYNDSLLEKAINDQKIYADNRAFRTLKSHRKLFGKPIIFTKRIIRKVLKWYIEPICDQQSDFNHATVEASDNIRRNIINLEERVHGASDRIIGNEVRLFQQEERQKILELNMEATEKTSMDLSNMVYTLKNKMEDTGKATIDIVNRMSAMEEKMEDTGRAKVDIANRISVTERLMEDTGKATIDIANRMSAMEEKMEDTGRATEDFANRIKELEGKLRETIDQLKPKFEFGSTISSSQSGEDLIVAYILDALHIPFSDCSYLDLGANHAKFMSNSYFFYRYGARGVLVEANPDLIEELKEYRKGDIILNRCLGGKSGEVLKFYILNGDGLSSPDYEYVQECLKKNENLYVKKVVDIETISIQEIISHFFREPPMLVNLDIEGMEIDLLHNFDLEACRPLCFIIETVEYEPGLHILKKNKEIIQFMENNDYTEYAFTGINSIFVDSRRLS